MTPGMTKDAFKLAKYPKYDGNTLYKETNFSGEDKDDYATAVYNKPRTDELPKEFVNALIEYNRIDEDPQIREFENFIKKDIYKFGKTLININRKYTRYNIKISIDDIKVSECLGYYDQLGETFKYQIQNIDETLVYRVDGNIKMTISDDNNIVLNEANIGKVAYGVPKMVSNIEDHGTTPKQSLLLDLQTVGTNYFFKGGTRIKINYEESNMPNIVGCRKINEDEFKLDIISSKTDNVSSSHLDISYNRATSEASIGLSVSKLDQKIRLSIKTAFMLCGIFDFKVVLENVVNKNDPDYYIITDIIWNMWTAKNEHIVDITRKANSIDDLYIALKPQIYIKNPQKYNSLTSISLFTMLSTTLLSRLADVDSKGVLIKSVYLGNLLNILAKTSVGSYQATDRYTYANKSIKSPVTQMRGVLTVVFRNQVVNPIYKVLSTHFNNSEEFTNEKLNKIRSSLQSLAKEYNTITNNVILRIRTGKTMEEQNLAKKTQQQELTQQTQAQAQAQQQSNSTRDVNSRNDEISSTVSMMRSGQLLYIKEDLVSKTISEHSAFKRQPESSAETAIDCTYTPDGSTDVGLRREIGALTSYSIHDYTNDEILTALRQIKGFNDLRNVHELSDHHIIRIIIDGIVYGYCMDGPKFRKDIAEARRLKKFPADVSAKFYYDRREIEVSSARGRLKNLALPINPTTGELYITIEDINAIIRKEKSVQDMIDAGKIVWMFLHECNNIRYSNNLQSVKDESGNYYLGMNDEHRMSDSNAYGGYDYYVNEMARRSVTNLLYLPCMLNGGVTRRTMVTNQNKSFVTIQPDTFAPSLDKNQNTLIGCEVANFACTYKAPYPASALNLLVAFSGANENIDEDSSGFSSKLREYGVISRVLKIKINTDSSQDFLNPNIQKDNWKAKSPEYAKLNEHGWVDENVMLFKGDIMYVMKVKEAKADRIVPYRWQKDEMGRVRVVNYSIGQNKIASLTIACEYSLIPKDGNKFYITNACKTVGREVHDNTMPLTEEGLHVSMCYTREAIVRRDNMTIDKTIAIQTSTGTGGGEDQERDIRDFVDLGVLDDDIVAYLTKMHNLKDDEKLTMKSRKFMGYSHLFYQETMHRTIKKVPVVEFAVSVTKHVAYEKENVKPGDETQKNINPKTGQPPGGKQMRGGQKYGKLSFHSLDDSGSKEAMFSIVSDNSDGRLYPICKTCGSSLGVIQNIEKGMASCNRCGIVGEISNVNSSFSSNKANMMFSAKGQERELIPEDVMVMPVVQL